MSFFGFESDFTRDPFIFMGFQFLETIPTQLPNPTQPIFLGFWGEFDRVFWVDPTHVHP